MGRRLALILLSAVLMCAGWLQVSGLPMCVALVPLMYLCDMPCERASRRAFFLGAAVFGLWSLATTFWVWFAAPVGTVAIVVAHMLLFGASLSLWQLALRHSTRTVSYTVLICSWIAAEWWLMQGEISFPWLTLGNALANDTWAVQWYEYTGVWGGSLWLLVCNVLVYEALRRRSLRHAAAAGAAVALPVAISLVMYLGYTEPSENVLATVVQPNIDPYTEKFGLLTQEDQNRIMLSLASQAPEDTEYIVFPETCVNEHLREHAFGASESIAEFLAFLQDRPDAQMILGATTYRYYRDGSQSPTARHRGTVWMDVYNSAIALDADGNAAVHHKNKLVVGAEKMPYRRLMSHFDGLIVSLGGTTGQMGTDDATVVFRHEDSAGRQVSGAAAICYESVYGAYLSRFVRAGAQLLFVITNDGWWRNTPGYRQHFSYSRLRAIELRRSVARSANTGISGFINPRGDVIGSLGWDRRDLLSERIPLSGRITFYAVHGDYIPRICVLLLAMALLYLAASGIRRRDLPTTTH